MVSFFIINCVLFVFSGLAWSFKMENPEGKTDDHITSTDER